MSYFKELEMMIQERAEYNPDTDENRTTYLQLKDEINEHISGTLEYNQLSPIAKDLMADWENTVTHRTE